MTFRYSLTKEISQRSDAVFCLCIARIAASPKALNLCRQLVRNAVDRVCGRPAM